jgi:hypothetical protein
MVVHIMSPKFGLPDKTLADYSGDCVPTLVLTPLEFVYNKPHPSILLSVQDATTQKNLILLLLQEIKRDIIYRHAQLTTPHHQEELHPRIQAYLQLDTLLEA